MFVVKRTTTTTTSSLIFKGIIGGNNRTIVSASAPRHANVYEALRRKRERQGLVNIEAEEESETAIFPNERLGLDYSLNWVLNGYAITPTNQAYRNPSLKHLFQHADGKKEASGALSVAAQADVKPATYFLDEQMAALNGASTLSVPQYKAVLRAVKDHVSDSRNIYVHDAAVGSHRSCEGLVRAITNDAQSALFLKHLLPSAPLPDVKEFKHSLTLYLVPNLVLPSPATMGLSSSSFNIIDVKRGIAVICGVQSTENIRKTLSCISSPYLFNTHQGIAMSADIFHTKDQKSILVFSSDNYLLNKKFESGNVISQGSLWNKEGLFRMFDSISYPTESSAKKPFDLIERFSNKKVTSTTPVDATLNVYPSPSSVVFLIRDSKGVIPPFSELTPEQAEKYFTAGFSGDSFSPYYSSEPISLAPKGKSELFKNADVDKLLSVISSGKVNKSTKSALYATLSPIKLSETKVSEADKNKVADFESNFESIVGKLLQ
eukprot:gene11375-13260_t